MASFQINETSKPRVAVIDHFSTSNPQHRVDIDGDGKKDNISHGQVVSAYLKSQGVEPVPYDVDEIGGLEEALQAVYGDVVSGSSINGVNISLGTAFGQPTVMTYSELSQRVQSKLAYNNEDDKPPTVTIIPANVREYEEQIAAIYDDVMEQTSGVENATQRIREPILALHERGIPVFQSAGNNGRRMVSLRNLVSGAVRVGATNAQGRYMYYSQSGDVKAKGTYPVFAVEGGFDITGDGKADFAENQATGGSPQAEKYVGQHKDDVVKSIPESIAQKLGHVRSSKMREQFVRKLIDEKKLPDGLYDVADYEEVIFQPPVTQYRMPRLGMGGQVLDPKSGLLFRIDQEGLVQFDPDESGRKGAVGQVYGTSLSTPRYAGFAVNAKARLEHSVQEIADAFSKMFIRA